MVMERNARGQVFANKVRAEALALDAAGVATAGNACSSVLLAKGEPGPAEKGGQPLLAGADGKALRAALVALGYAPEDWAAVATWAVDGSALDSALVRQAIMALDPATLVTCDETSAQAVREALANDLIELNNLEDALLAPGRVAHVLGMRVLNLGGFEAALADVRQKQVMWARLKQIPPLSEPY